MIYGILLLIGALLGFFTILLGYGALPEPRLLSSDRRVFASGSILTALVLIITIIWIMYQTATPGPAIAHAARQLMAKADVALILWHRKLPDNSHPGLSVVDIRSADDTIRYVTAIGSTGSVQFLNTVKQMNENTKDTACTDPEYAEKLKWGLSIEWIYQSSGLGSDPFVMTPEMCGY